MLKLAVLQKPNEVYRWEVVMDDKGDLGAVAAGGPEPRHDMAACIALLKGAAERSTDPARFVDDVAQGTLRVLGVKREEEVAVSYGQTGCPIKPNARIYQRLDGTLELENVRQDALSTSTHKRDQP